MLESKRDHENPLTPSEASGLLGRLEPGGKLSKATAKRTLRTLVGIGLVQMIADGNRRTGYFTNASIVENGLRKLRKRVKSEIVQEIGSVEAQEKAIANLDCATLAQDLVEELTGHRHRISSRLITGEDDIKRAIGYNMGDIARKGDIIRVTIVSFSPFLDEQEKLIDGIARAARNGAEVRCLLYARLENAPSGAAAQMGKGKRTDTHESSEGQKLTVQMKLCDRQDAYHAATFGEQYMALVVSEDPVTVAWITREFNPDIIDTSNSVFDAIWQDARSIVEAGAKRISSTDPAAGRLEKHEKPLSRAYVATNDGDEVHTKDEQIAAALDLVGFNSNEERFSVLRIVLQKQHRLGNPTDFRSIYEQIKEESGKKDIRRSQVYRALASLENDGYIRGDRTSHPFHYAATLETLISALGNAEMSAFRRLELRRAELDSEIGRLSGLNLARLAADTIEMTTGIPPRASASFAEGYDQIGDLADTEVYSVSRKGDTVRVSLGWTRSIPNVARARIETLIHVIRRGAKMKVLVAKQWEDDDSAIELLTSIYESLLQENRDVSVRVRGTKESTYQFVARNNEGIFLIVSEEPPAATYIPRSVNQRLVDDAIASFDAEFETGANLHSKSSESV